MFDKKTVRDIDVNDKVVLVRADYNVPLSEAEEVADDLRIRASLPTLQYLLEQDARKVVVISHLGRPEGRLVRSLSLEPVARRLAELLPGVEVGFVPYVTGFPVEEAVQSMNERGVLLLENLRFDPGEERDDAEFAQAIVTAVQPEVFVQDGFGVVHRAHASTDALARAIPAVAGLLLEKEVENLSAARTPEEPAVAIVGGAKVEDKAPLIEKLAQVYGRVYVGGKIANEWSSDDNPRVVMPVDFVLDAEGVARDIGEQSTRVIEAAVAEARTVLWNGSLGQAEKPEYAQASFAVARAMGRLAGTRTIIGGGDTTGLVEGLIESEPELHYSLISTGGGAALEFLLGEKLPGIEVLLTK
jgi:phosphoglycerate kinase